MVRPHGSPIIVGVKRLQRSGKRGIPQLLGGRYGSIKLFRAGPLFTAA